MRARMPDDPSKAHDDAADGDAMVSADGPTTAVGGVAPSQPPSSTPKPKPVARGAAIGRYLVVDRLGAGGMGEVLLAYDPELDRRVAVKLLRISSRSDPGRARRRLLREAQALAKLSHPHVVSVFDVGTHGRSVFVAMEFIEGQTLKQWLETRDRPWPEVIEVMLDAGSGLAAAHAAGLVHRDFKPTNVMVGDDGRVRVLDFGLARRFETAASSGTRDDVDMSSSLDDDDLDVPDSFDVGDYPLSDSVTETGMVMGTPAFMAPEQFFGGDVDARTDQFAFCVVMYRALFSTAPFPGKTFEELGRAVERGELAEPARASNVPRAIRAALQRGLSVRARERFGGMNELLTTVRRASDRRKRRPVYLAVALGTAAVATGVGWRASQAGPCEGLDDRLGGVWDDDRRARVERAFEDSAVAYAGEVTPRVVAGLDAYASEWTAMRAEACEATHVSGHQSARVLDLRVACLDARRRDVEAVVDVLLSPDGDVVRNAVVAVEQIRTVEPCADVERLLAGFEAPPDAETADAVQEIRAALASVRAQAAAGKYADALRAAKPAHARAESLDYLPVLAESSAALGMLHERLGPPDEALAAYDDALWAATASGHSEFEARALIGLAATTANHMGDLSLALRHARVADAVLHRLEDPPLLSAELQLTRGTVLLRSRELPEALAAYERAAGLAGDHAAAQQVKIAALINIAATLGTRGDYEASIEATLEAIDHSESRLGPKHPLVSQMYNNLGVTYVRAGDHERSARAQRHALHIAIATLGETHPDTARSYHNLGVALAEAGKLEEALDNYRRGYEIKNETLGPKDPSTAYSANNVADALFQLGRGREGLPYVEQALEIWDGESETPHADAAYAWVSLAQIRLGLGEIELAREAIDHGLDMIDDTGYDPLEVARVKFVAAQVFDEFPGQQDRARALANESIAAYEATQDGSSDEVAEIRRWLANQPAG